MPAPPPPASVRRSSRPCPVSVHDTARSTSRPMAAWRAKELEKFLINFVVEQTGYPPEVVELDADLEADLGIDSIKKAQLFGELRRILRRAARRRMTLDDFPTLRHVLNFLQSAGQMPRQPHRRRRLAAPAVPGQRPDRAAAAAPPRPQPQPRRQPRPTPAELEKFLINFVVEQTGYPPEVVELDADLEADLGIDSIKKAQLFGELRRILRRAADGRHVARRFPDAASRAEFPGQARRSRPRLRLPRARRRARHPMRQPGRRNHSELPVALAAAATPVARESRPPARSWRVPDQLRGRADRLSAGGGRARRRPGSRSGDRQHQEGPTVRRVAEYFEVRRRADLSLDNFTTCVTCSTSLFRRPSSDVYWCSC